MCRCIVYSAVRCALCTLGDLCSLALTIALPLHINISRLLGKCHLFTEEMPEGDRLWHQPEGCGRTGRRGWRSQWLRELAPPRARRE